MALIVQGLTYVVRSHKSVATPSAGMTVFNGRLRVVDDAAKDIALELWEAGPRRR